MTNADWWARVIQARTEHDDLLPHRVWALRKDGHEATMALKAVPGIGAEIVLTVDGEMRKTRLVPIARAGGAGRRDRGHANDVRGEGVGVNAVEREEIDRLEAADWR